MKYVGYALGPGTIWMGYLFLIYHGVLKLSPFVRPSPFSIARASVVFGCRWSCKCGWRRCGRW